MALPPSFHLNSIGCALIGLSNGGNMNVFIIIVVTAADLSINSGPYMSGHVPLIPPTHSLTHSSCSVNSPPYRKQRDPSSLKLITAAPNQANVLLLSLATC